MGSSLVSPTWLEANLENPYVRIIEVSSSDDDSNYRESHIPGAVWRFWKDLCWHESDREFPAPDEMARRMGEMGIRGDATVIL